MPYTFDNKPHPQLRYTVMLEWRYPDGSNEINQRLIYMTEEEYMGEAYCKILDRNKEEIQQEWESYWLTFCKEDLTEWQEITEWGEYSVANDFFNKNVILSEAICSYLKIGRRYEELPYTPLSEYDILKQELEFAYLYEIRSKYTKVDVADEILKVTRNPKYEYAQRIMAIWGHTLRPQYVESQLRSIINTDNINDQLRKLLKDNTDENLRLLKAKLELLIKDWNLLYEKNNHKRAILVYRFLNDCNLINRNNESLKSMLEIVYSYLSLPPCTYNKEIQLTEPSEKEYEAYYNKEKLNAVTKRKCKIYPSINAKWATFKAKTHLT